MLQLLVMMIILLIMGTLFVIWVWYNPESILIPLNLLYLIDSSPRTTFYTEEEKNSIFPTGKILEANWKEIRGDGYELYESLPNKNINYLDNYNINLGAETKRQWTTIPLRLFGHDFSKYMDKCPFISNIIRSHPEIKSCLFSIMEPGKIIQPHVGPYDGLLRYQLALDIPILKSQSCNPTLSDSKEYQSCNPTLSNSKEYQVCNPTLSDSKEYQAYNPTLSDSKEYQSSNRAPRETSFLPVEGTSFSLQPDSNRDLQSQTCTQDSIEEECYLHVGGERYYWTEGKGVLFDEANLHGAINTTNKRRMVLLIDIERPYNFWPYRILNTGIIYGMGLLPATKRATLT
ncbi:Aspartyl/asparaginyl beta-hydroxylase [uncultured virus]|nr:Aspartyl/asparaginyl beta-hydroxylase [uncultured virus]